MLKYLLEQMKGKRKMALIKCPECGKEISDRASTCINWWKYGHLKHSWVLMESKASLSISAILSTEMLSKAFVPDNL